MRTARLVALLIISLPLACSDDEVRDGDASGVAGSNSGGAAGRGGAGNASDEVDPAGPGGATGAAGSAVAGSAGSGGAAGSAGSGGAAGAGQSSASGATGCEGLCARPLVCPGGTRADCLSSCESAAELCPDELEALLECAESLSDDDFQCVGGDTIPNDDFCVTQSAAYARCRIGF